MRLRPYGESGAAHHVVRRPRALPRHAGPRVGALRVAQGAARSPATRHDELDALVTPVRVSASTSTTTPTRGCATSTARSASRARAATTRPTSSSATAASARSSSSRRRCRSCAAGASPTCACAARCPRSRRSARADLLPRVAPPRLREAYVFLRNVEHRLQYRDDQQTQQLPERSRRARVARGGDGTRRARRVRPRARARIAAWSSLTFAQTLRRSAAPSTPDAGHDVYAALWDDAGARAGSRARGLREAGFADPAGAGRDAARVRELERATSSCPAASRQRFDALVPQLLAAAAAQPGADGRAGRVRAPARAARNRRAAQRLSRARRSSIRRCCRGSPT